MIFATITFSLDAEGQLRSTMLPKLESIIGGRDNPMYKQVAALQAVISSIDPDAINRQLQELLPRTAPAPEAPPDHTRPSPKPTSDN